MEYDCFRRVMKKQKKGFPNFLEKPLSSTAIGSRTPNLLIRSQVLYPIEPWLHLFLSGSNIMNCFEL